MTCPRDLPCGRALDPGAGAGARARAFATAGQEAGKGLMKFTSVQYPNKVTALLTKDVKGE